MPILLTWKKPTFYVIQLKFTGIDDSQDFNGGDQLADGSSYCGEFDLSEVLLLDDGVAVDDHVSHSGALTESDVIDGFGLFVFHFYYIFLLRKFINYFIILKKNYLIALLNFGKINLEYLIFSQTYNFLLINIFLF